MNTSTLCNFCLLVIITQFAQSCTHAKKELSKQAIDRYVLREVRKSCLSKNFYYRDSSKNNAEISKIRNMFVDTINNIIIERHFWHAGGCDKNTFYLFRQNNTLFFLPYCDENILLNKSINSVPDTLANTSLEKYFNTSLNRFKLNNKGYYYNFFINSILNDTSNRHDKHNEHSDNKSYPMKYSKSSSCSWQVTNKKGEIKFMIVNANEYHCYSI